MQSDSIKVLMLPVWLNILVTNLYLFMVVLMGLALFVSIMAVDMLGILTYIPLQMAFLVGLFKWNKFAYLPVPKTRRIMPLEPSEQALTVHMLTGSTVYLLQDIDVSGYVKIGRSINPYHRLRDFGVKLPFATRLIHVIQCRDDRRVEGFLHEYFAHRHVNGEWFALTREDVETIKQFDPSKD
jgi:hypothetical protein